MSDTDWKLRPKSILVVDDEPDVANILRLLLTFNGHNVDVVTNVERALAVYDASPYDLVITDFMMPRISGLELARQIKERAPEQLILMVSAFAQALPEEEKKRMCIDGLLEKPFSPQQLHEAIVSVFFKARPENGLNR